MHPTPIPTCFSRVWLPLGLVLWACAIAGGICAEWKYSRTPGNIGEAPRQWPVESRLAPPVGPTLLLFAHPRCPCTAASLNELASLLSEAPQPIDVRVVFWQPRGGGQDWRETPLVRQAQSLPGVRIEWDEEGLESALFGSSTSGHTICFDGCGEQRFVGGITLARGQIGDNAGRAAIRDWLAGIHHQDHAHPIYGCPLVAAPSPTN